MGLQGLPENSGVGGVSLDEKLNFLRYILFRVHHERGRFLNFLVILDIRGL